MDYKIIRNALSPNEIEMARSCIDKQTMDYGKMRSFIDQTMLQAYNKHLGSSIVYSKFRVSNNNNSTDAGGFHRDVHLTHTNTIPIPVYTCLAYLDKTVMELIPQSNTRQTMTYYEAITTYGSAIRIELHPGDLLIFHSSLIHRGIFTEQLENRRLIQVFNCFLSPSEYQTYSPLIMDVEGDDTFGWLTKLLFKSSITGAIPNLFGYLNAATGYGGRVSSVPEQYTLFSGDGLCKRTTSLDVQPTNLYYIRRPLITLPPHFKAEYKYAKYNQQFYLYLFVLVIVICAIMYGGYKSVYALIPLLQPIRKRKSKRADK